MRVAPRLVRYEAPGWGIGELWLDGERVMCHEAPRSRPGSGLDDAHPLTRRLRAFFEGATDDFADVEIDLESLTPYGRALARELRGVPRGAVVTYAELAALAGRPGAARAAGSFCARNELALFVPCHRVVSSGGIGGYGSTGVEYKRRLLQLERAHL